MSKVSKNQKHFKRLRKKALFEKQHGKITRTEWSRLKKQKKYDNRNP